MQDRIKVVIVDDEPQSIHRLQDDLATLEDFEVIATSSSAVSAKNLVMSIQPDVLFIDVEMPGQTGFEVLQSLRDEIPMDLIVVFYSAFDKYMIDALRASAFDFLLKPYQQDEFELVVDRIRQKMKDGDDVDEDASSFPESSSHSFPKNPEPSEKPRLILKNRKRTLERKKHLHPHHLHLYLLT
jgi:two-component system LytT family response regulator